MHSTGPIHLDPHIASKITQLSIDRYRKCLRLFLGYIIKSGFVINDVAELDDLLVEWKNHDSVSKSNFEGAVACVEMALPAAKHHLPWSRAVVKAWSVSHVARHTIPLCEGPCILIACHLASRGHGRLGAGMVLQQALGLRPSEVLGLQAVDVMLPEERGLEPTAPVVVGLGIRTGTKAKRAQTVSLQNPTKAALLRWLKRGTKPDHCIVGYTYESYRRLLRQMCGELRLEVEFTPHSPRAGFATECVSAGLGLARTRELGRWVSEASCRTYLDVSSAAAIQTNLATQNLADPIAYCYSHLLEFFAGAQDCFHTVPRDAPAVFATDAARGLIPGRGRQVLPARLAAAAGSGQLVSVADAETLSGVYAASASRSAGRGRGHYRRKVVEEAAQVGHSAQRSLGRGRS